MTVVKSSACSLVGGEGEEGRCEGGLFSVWTCSETWVVMTALVWDTEGLGAGPCPGSVTYQLCDLEPVLPDPEPYLP